MLKKFIAVICLSAYINICLAQTTILSDALDEFIQQKLPNAQVGVVIQSAETGDILYQRQADNLFYPASNTKLFLAAAALRQLGKDFRFETRLLSDNKSIYLQFNGDPSLTASDVNKLIQTLKEKDIQTIKGNFVIDDSAFSGPMYGPGWTWDSIPWYYSAPVSAIIINENKTQVNVLESKKLKKPVKFAYRAQFPKMKVNANVTGVTKEAAEKECQLNVIQKHDEIHLDGCWPIDSTPKTLELSLQDPRYIAVQAVKQALKDNNIKLKGNLVFGKTNQKSKTIATHRSKPLPELLKPVLEDSNNLMTDAITKTLGISHKGEGTFQQGVNAIKATLSNAYNLPSDGYKLYDGSGASRYTLISVAYIAELLYQMYKDPLFQEFQQALPRAGATGSLDYRMKDSDLINKLAAKTGSAKGTSALSGYLKAKNDKIYIFSIVINQSLDKTENLKLIEDKFCKLLYEQL